jgi:hypothetical protein
MHERTETERRYFEIVFDKILGVVLEAGKLEPDEIYGIIDLPIAIHAMEAALAMVAYKADLYLEPWAQQKFGEKCGQNIAKYMKAFAAEPNQADLVNWTMNPVKIKH